MSPSPRRDGVQHVDPMWRSLWRCRSSLFSHQWTSSSKPSQLVLDGVVITVRETGELRPLQMLVQRKQASGLLFQAILHLPKRLGAGLPFALMWGSARRLTHSTEVASTIHARNRVGCSSQDLIGTDWVDFSGKLSGDQTLKPKTRTNQTDHLIQDKETRRAFTP